MRHDELPLDPDAVTPRPIHLVPLHVLMVFIGGGIGTFTRYAGGALFPHAGDAWPVATFVINIAGALILGVLLEGLSQSRSATGTRLRLLVGTGFCGGLTTYSTFAVEMDLLVRAGSPWLAVAYGVASLIGGIVAAYVGIAIATRVRA